MPAACGCKTGGCSGGRCVSVGLWTWRLLREGAGHGRQAAPGVPGERVLFSTGSPPNGDLSVWGGTSDVRTGPGPTLISGLLEGLGPSGTPVSRLPLPAVATSTFHERRVRWKPVSSAIDPGHRREPPGRAVAPAPGYPAGGAAPAHAGGSPAERPAGAAEPAAVRCPAPRGQSGGAPWRI